MFLLNVSSGYLSPLAILRLASGQLAQQRLSIHTDTHGRELQRAVQHRIPHQEVSIQPDLSVLSHRGPVVIVRRTAIVLLPIAQWRTNTWGTSGAQVIDRKQGHLPLKAVWRALDEVLSFTCEGDPYQKYLWGILGAQVRPLTPHLRGLPLSEIPVGQGGCAGDWHEAGFSPTERTEGRFARSGRHRRLAKAGSPATARGCGEL